MERLCSWNDPQLLQLGPVKLRTLVEGVLDVSSAYPRRYFFEVSPSFSPFIFVRAESGV